MNVLLYVFYLFYIFIHICTRLHTYIYVYLFIFIYCVINLQKILSILKYVYTVNLYQESCFFFQKDSYLIYYIFLYFCCAHIDLALVYIQEIVEHNKIYHPDRPHICEHCGETFTRNQQFQVHVQGHITPKVKAKSETPSKFSLLLFYRNAILYILNLKPHQCSHHLLKVLCEYCINVIQISTQRMAVKICRMNFSV